MKKIVIIISTTVILLLILSSCRTYLDDGKYLPIINETFKIYGFEDYNELKYQSKIGSIADKQSYFPQHFNIHLPKRIKSWSALNDANFIDYDKNGLIVVDAGNINKEIQIKPWKRIDDKIRVSNYMNYYYKLKKKQFNYDKTIKYKNVKLYTDGKTYILFYKIENSEIFNFENILNSFHYLD